MGIQYLKAKIGEQKQVYDALKAGKTDTVCYKEFQNGEWGTDDENYTNRLRLAYYLLYFQIDDEEVMVYLFQEELKDREQNSFQGIGSTLQVLTQLIRPYNTDAKYADLLKRAKNANFDCACGYDPDHKVEENFARNDLLDCIYLCMEMDYKDVMGKLVDEWKDSTRRELMEFQTFLGRDAENEKLFQEQLTETLSAKNSRTEDIISAYKELIQYYLHMKNYKKAHDFCNIVIETTDYEQIKTIRLYKNILEACFEVTANDPNASSDLWNWAKTRLQNVPKSSRYGDLYTKGIAAAKAIGDPYGKELEQEYEAFLASFRALHE